MWATPQGCLKGRGQLAVHCPPCPRAPVRGDPPSRTRNRPAPFQRFNVRASIPHVTNHSSARGCRAIGEHDRGGHQARRDLADRAVTEPEVEVATTGERSRPRLRAARLARRPAGDRDRPPRALRGRRAHVARLAQGAGRRAAARAAGRPSLPVSRRGASANRLGREPSQAMSSLGALAFAQATPLIDPLVDGALTGTR